MGVLVMIGGCGTSAASVWRADTWWITAGEGANVEGVATLQVFDGPWDRAHHPRHHRCATLWEVTGVPDPTCAACDVAWAVTLAPLDGDCGDGDDPLDPPTGIGFGARGGGLEADSPVGAIEAGSWVRYADGPWMPHGWAFRGPPTDPDGAAPAWDGSTPTTAWPAWAVGDAEPGGDLQPVR